MTADNLFSVHFEVPEFKMQLEPLDALIVSYLHKVKHCSFRKWSYKSAFYPMIVGESTQDYYIYDYLYFFTFPKHRTKRGRVKSFFKLLNIVEEYFTSYHRFEEKPKKINYWLIDSRPFHNYPEYQVTINAWEEANIWNKISNYQTQVRLLTMKDIEYFLNELLQVIPLKKNENFNNRNSLIFILQILDFFKRLKIK